MWEYKMVKEPKPQIKQTNIAVKYHLSNEIWPQTAKKEVAPTHLKRIAQSIGLWVGWNSSVSLQETQNQYLLWFLKVALFSFFLSFFLLLKQQELKYTSRFLTYLPKSYILLNILFYLNFYLLCPMYIHYYLSFCNFKSKLICCSAFAYFCLSSLMHTNEKVTNYYFVGNMPHIMEQYDFWA